MGKGQRARQARVGKREEMKAAAIKLRRRKKIVKIISMCVAIVLAIGIVSTVIYNSIANTGYFLRNTVVMSTKNFEVDNAMMAYYIKNEFYSFADQYSDYLSMYGLDTTKSLKSQKYGDKTWFDEFLSAAKEQVNDILLCAEKAKENGREISEENLKNIDTSIQSMKDYAKENNISFDAYLSQIFAKGINEDDIRRAMELSYLAQEYYNDYYEKLEYNDEQLKQYFDNNKSEFVKADYLSYSFTSTNTDKEAAKAESKVYSDKLSACKSVVEFKSTLEAMLTDYYTEANTNEDAEAAKEEIASNVESDMNSLEGTDYYPESTEEQTDLEKWMFSDSTKIGDTFVEVPDEDGKSYTTYILVKPMYYDDYATANVRHILLSADTEDEDAMKEVKEEANKLVEEFNNSEKTSAAFEKIAKEHSDDANVESNGGLYEGVTKNTASYPQQFIDWSFDATRKVGDIGIIETDSGYHVMYYEGIGDIAWKTQANAGHKADDWEAHLEETLKTYPIESNDKKMNKINI